MPSHDAAIRRKFDPDWVVAPGETLADWFEEMHLPHRVAWEVYGIPERTLNGVLRGTTKITPKLAWQREGRPKTRAHYQTLQGACRCVDRQLTAREEMDWLEEYRRPAEIVFGPIIERREVGAWEPTARIA